MSERSTGPVLSVIVPCFNEFQTVRKSLERLRAAALPGGTRMQVILVDDGSTDGTARLLKSLRPLVDMVVRHRRNRGKGAAVRSGLRRATGEYVVVHDADLEYDPRDLALLLRPLLDDLADVVYGSRFLSSTGGRRVLYYWNTVINGWLTQLSNMLTNLNLTDMSTCYKMMRRSVLDGLPLEEDGFGIEAELTAKLAKRFVRFYEVGISYHGRTWGEGKKIRPRDGLRLLWAILRYSRNSMEDVGRQTLERLETHGEYARWIFSQFEPHIGQRVLEFGSGLGSMARHLTDREQVFITDYTAGYLPDLRRQFGGLHNMSVHQLDITDPPADLRDAALDTVFSSNVVEHIEDDVAALRGAHSLLRPGGKCIILVPAHPQLYCRMDHNLEHFRRYTKRTLTRSLEAAGFEVLDVHYMNMVGGIGWYVAGQFFRQSVITRFNIWLHKIVEPVNRAVDRLFGGRPPMGLSVIAVARKPG